MNISEPEKKRSVSEHLRELRKRLIICFLAVVAGFMTAYGFSVELLTILTAPIISALPPGQDYMVFTSVVEPFFIYLKVGVVCGILITSPVILYQCWAFIAPGLYRTERIWFVSVVAASVVLFAAGALFAFFVVFPFGFKYFLSFSGQELRPVLSIGLYFSFVIRLLLAFGIIFQLPLAIFVLSTLGIVTAAKLFSWWRYALVGILIVSAVLTPTPDVFNLLLMAGPLVILYAVGIIVAKIFGKDKMGLEEPDCAGPDSESKIPL